MRFFTVVSAVLSLVIGALLFSGCGKEVRDDRAILKLYSNPDGAVVTLLKREVGNTPYGCRISHGTHVVKIAKPNYYPVWMTVTLKPGEEKKINVTLEPEKASVLFTSKPSGAAVYLNDKFLGETPFVFKDVAPGNYTALLKLPGYSPQSIQWNVSSARPQSINTVLVSNVGSLKVTSVPDKAQVKLNDAPVGDTPYNARLEQGKYKVTVVKSGFSVYEQTVLVNRDREAIVQAKMEPLPGNLKLTTAPSGASVSINGKDYGSTPLNVSSLPRGHYKVEFRKAGFDPVSIEIDLAGGQTVERNLVLSSSTGQLDFVTYPPGVTVYLDGKLKGATVRDPNNPEISSVFSIRGLIPGKHTLELVHKRARPNRKVITVRIEKGKTERLDNLTMWIANSTLEMKDGRITTGRFIARQANGKVMFEPEPGVQVTYRADEIKSITPIKDKE